MTTIEIFEKVNPYHPDKIADRIGGAIVDLAYSRKDNPIIAGECLLGHNSCTITIESNVFQNCKEDYEAINNIVKRITGQEFGDNLHLILVSQDENLNKNQKGKIRCGDNGIFKGTPTTELQQNTTDIMGDIVDKIGKYDGKIINCVEEKEYDKDEDTQDYDKITELDNITVSSNKYVDRFKKTICTNNITLCQSNLKGEHREVENIINKYTKADGHICVEMNKVDDLDEESELFEENKILNKNNIIINPIGEWVGGLNVDTGSCNRKLGTDFGDAITGGGLHFKDLSKADVSINIMCFILAQKYQSEVKAYCSIGDERVKFYFDKKILEIDYDVVVEKVRKFINSIGGFEKLAEWGLIAPQKLEYRSKAMRVLNGER